MKQRIVFFIASMLLSTLVLQAQTETAHSNESAFLKDLTTYKKGEGTVKIIQDARLPQAIADRHTYTEDEEIPYILVTGYRVQAYSSNIPKTARNEAIAMENKIKEKMPDVPSYVSFSSPFWKVRLGDCRTYKEALTLLGEVRRNFPEYRSNFYIVKEDNIRISIK